MVKNSKTALGTKVEENDSSFHTRNQWWLYSSKAKSSKDSNVKVIDAWKITRGQPCVTIAFLDSEIEYNSYFGHGALCAELAAGRFGVAPACTSLLVKIPIQSADDNFIKLFENLGKKSDIICCSWAATPIYRPLSSRLFNCISQLAKHGGPQKKGCLICFAAGNYNAPVKDLANEEFVWLDESIDFIRVTKGPIENGFASHPDVITVAACTSTNKKAKYSNWGNEIDLCAPSSNFHPFSKTFEVEGRRSIEMINELGNVQSFGGTSAATALVAGVAALVRSANPDLSAAQIKNILQVSADKIIDYTSDQVNGDLPGKYIAGKSRWFGYGKVNAGKAVSMATTYSLTER